MFISFENNASCYLPLSLILLQPVKIATVKQLEECFNLNQISDE